jgi:hypothetical protein
MKIKIMIFCALVAHIGALNILGINKHRHYFDYIKVVQINLSVEDVEALKSAIRNGDLSKLKLLLEKVNNINSKIELEKIIPYSATPLILAAQCGQDNVVKLLLEMGADVNGEDNYGRSALATARKISTHKLLLHSGADIEHRDIDGKTPLINTAIFEHTEVLRNLIEEGADVNATDNLGGTALIYAAQKEDTEIVTNLILAGADVNATDCNGTTSLMWAANSDNLNTVKVLLKAGASAKIKDSIGRSALDYAKKNPYLPNNKKIRALLLKTKNLK